MGFSTPWPFPFLDNEPLSITFCPNEGCAGCDYQELGCGCTGWRCHTCGQFWWNGEVICSVHELDLEDAE